MAKRKDTSGLAPVIASPVAATPKNKQLNLCACGCGRTTGKVWFPGDDAVHKGRLLDQVDGGDAEKADDAGFELVMRGWSTAERLERRALKRSERAVVRAERAAAKEAAKAAAAAKPKARTIKVKSGAGAQAPAPAVEEVSDAAV